MLVMLLFGVIEAVKLVSRFFFLIGSYDLLLFVAALILQMNPAAFVIAILTAVETQRCFQENV